MPKREAAAHLNIDRTIVKRLDVLIEGQKVIIEGQKAQTIIGERIVEILSNIADTQEVWREKIYRILTQMLKDKEEGAKGGEPREPGGVEGEPERRSREGAGMEGKRKGERRQG
jgi:hypothetical protein